LKALTILGVLVCGALFLGDGTKTLNPKPIHHHCKTPNPNTSASYPALVSFLAPVSHFFLLLFKRSWKVFSVLGFVLVSLKLSLSLSLSQSGKDHLHPHPPLLLLGFCISSKIYSVHPVLLLWVKILD
jgi:hypothetical protein